MNYEIFTETNFFCSFLKGSETFDFVSILPDDQLQEIMENPLLAKVWINTSHSAYVATETESNGAKIDGFFYPNFM